MALLRLTMPLHQPATLTHGQYRLDSDLAQAVRLKKKSESKRPYL